MKNLPLCGKQVPAGRKVIRWNTNKEGGWEAYSELTKKNLVLEEVAKDETNDANKIMVKMDKELDRIKFNAFGKVKEKSCMKLDKEIEDLQKEKTEVFNSKVLSPDDVDEKIQDIDDKLTATLVSKQRETFEKELNTLRDMKKSKGKAAVVFNLKEKIVGSKGVATEAVTIVDPKTKAEVNNPIDIKRVSLQYCSELLTNRLPKADFEEDIEMKEIIHKLRMCEDVTEDDEMEELSEERFDKTYEMLAKRPGAKYKFIMKAGMSLKPALFNLCKIVWRTESQPLRWCKSTLIQQYKGKGSRSILDNQRHLHMKDEYPKFFGHLVVTAAKDKMIQNMSKFQIGTKPGHRAQEHIFVLKSVISLFLKYDKTIILSMWDVSKFFDREALSDCMNEVYRNEVRGKLYRLLYEMNKNTRISVQTPVGLTEERDTGEGVGQGTLEGAIVSAVNLDNGVQDFFHNSEYEVSYGDVRLQPILYQDDVARLSLDLESTQMGINKMEAMAETKLLNFNLEKSCFIVFGNKKSRKEIKENLIDRPLQLCGVDMVQEEQAKYLGDQLCGLGLAESVAATVDKRRGLVIRTIFEIRTVIDDCRSHVAGGLTSGLDIWEMAVIPMLTNNAECWQDVSSKTIDELDKIQLMFLRCLLAVGSGCPTPALFAATGTLKMEWRILEKKLLFLHHVASLPDTDLAKEIYNVQVQLSLPGIVQECQEFLAKFQITDMSSFTKLQWKKLVKSKIRECNKSDILKHTKSQGYKKLNYEEMENDSFRVKPYFSSLYSTDARLRFKIDCGMTPTIKMNFQSDQQHVRDLWTCPGCSEPGDVMGSRDTQRHVMVCPGYQEFREDKDLSQDKDIVDYFKQVIKHRLDNV